MSNITIPLDGVLLVNKPKGCTSHDVIARLRRKLKFKRIGHSGTLDPMATGLLLILLGKATKLSQYLMSLNKEYKGTLTFGEVSDTHDAEGNIVATCDVPDLTEEQIASYIQEFIGDQYQLPPMFSAKKIKGVPLYKMARKGQVVEREPRFIRISEFELTHFASPYLSFRVVCSKGTYVRTLAHDIGQKVGCGAHLNALERSGINHFKVEEALGLPEIEAMDLMQIRRHLIPPYRAVPSHVL